MRYRLTVATIVSALALAGAAQPAAADAAKYPLKGLAKSGSGSGSGTTPLTVLDDAAQPSTAPGSKQVLVLTQACFRVDAGTNAVTLSAGGITVNFAASNSNGGTGCQTFVPGFVIPEGTDVTCAATGTAAFTCTVAGVVAKAQ
jgi:hypothetical protein